MKESVHSFPKHVKNRTWNRLRFSFSLLIHDFSSQLCKHFPIIILIFNQAVLIMHPWRHYYYCCFFFVSKSDLFKLIFNVLQSRWLPLLKTGRTCELRHSPNWLSFISSRLKYHRAAFSPEPKIYWSASDCGINLAEFWKWLSLRSPLLFSRSRLFWFCLGTCFTDPFDGSARCVSHLYCQLLGAFFKTSVSLQCISKTSKGRKFAARVYEATESLNYLTNSKKFFFFYKRTSSSLFGNYDFLQTYYHLHLKWMVSFFK